MECHLQPKQWKIFNALEATGRNIPTIVGGGGAKGGGKSAGARNIAILLCSTLGDKYPGLTITIVRRVAKDLRDNHIDPLFRDYPELFPYWRATPHDLVLPNKSRIIFRSVETKEDVKRAFLGGFESTFIFIDEAQQFEQEEIQYIQAAARWTGKKGIPEGLCKTLLLFNPGGPGSTYIRRIFWTHEYEKNETPKNFTFVHVFGWDNYEWFRGQVEITEAEFYKIPSQCPEGNGNRCCRFHMFINETSEGRKYNAFPPAIREGYLMGSFDHFEGQYFAGAWDQQHCVLSPATVARLIQPWWTHWMSLDWGWAGPPRPHYSVCLWFAIGKLSPSQLATLAIESDYPIDVVIVYRSMHACLTPEPELARQIVSLTPRQEAESMSRFFVDGAVFSTDRKRPENTTADLMQPIFDEAGLPRMIPASKDRVNGWRQVYNGFLRSLKARTSPVFEEQEGPLLFVSAECAELCSSVPKLICDVEKNPHDVLKTESIEDDYGDDLRYGFKSMQDAEWEAPLEVRRAEVYHSYDAPTTAERSIPQMTALAMKMRMFDRDEKSRYKRVKRRR